MAELLVLPTGRSVGDVREKEGEGENREIKQTHNKKEKSTVYYSLPKHSILYGNHAG